MGHPPRKRTGKGRDGPPAGRRKPPPDATGEEGRWLAGWARRGSRLEVELIDGTRERGTLRSFDEDSIELSTAERPSLRLRKTQIRAIVEPD